MNPMRLVLICCVGIVFLGVAAVGYKWYRRPVAKSKDLRVTERSVYTGATASGAASRAAEDWPRWRGPRGDGISRETNLAERWPESGPPRLWTAEVGLGYASPVAVAGKVYLFTTAGGKDTLTCFDADTGKIVWNVQDSPGWIRSYEGTRATPTIEGDRIYTLGGTGDLTCRNLGDGAAMWKVNILQAKNSQPLRWGTASGPLIVGNLVYVQGGETGPVAVAVEKASGKIAWQSQVTGQAGYAPLTIVDVGGTQQLIVFAGTALVGMEPGSGRTIWQEPWETQYGVNGATPLYRDGQLFVSSAYDKGCMMLRLTATGATKLWENKDVQSRFQGMILEGDVVYANSEGVLKCVNWADGKVRWQSREPVLNKGGSLVRVGGTPWMILMSERGELTLAKVTPEKIEIVSQHKAFDEGSENWSTPLLYGGRLYAKGEKEFACFDVSSGIANAPASGPTTGTSARTE